MGLDIFTPEEKKKMGVHFRCTLKIFWLLFLDFNNKNLFFINPLSLLFPVPFPTPFQKRKTLLLWELLFVYEQ